MIQVREQICHLLSSDRVADRTPEKKTSRAGSNRPYGLLPRPGNIYLTPEGDPWNPRVGGG